MEQSVGERYNLLWFLTVAGSGGASLGRRLFIEKVSFYQVKLGERAVPNHALMPKEQPLVQYVLDHETY